MAAFKDSLAALRAFLPVYFVIAPIAFVFGAADIMQRSSVCIACFFTLVFGDADIVHRAVRMQLSKLIGCDSCEQVGGLHWTITS